MKKLIITSLISIILSTQYTNSQDRKFFYGNISAGNEAFFYFEDDTMYYFSFLSYTFCDLGYSLTCKCFKENDTIKAECIGDILIKKNRLLLIQKSASGKCKKTILREVFDKDELIKCLEQYGVIFKGNKIYVPDNMDNK